MSSSFQEEVHNDSRYSSVITQRLIMPSSSLVPLLLATSHLLSILPFLTAGSDVELTSPLLTLRGSVIDHSTFADQSLKASLRSYEVQKFIAQDTVLDGYITTYNYLGTSCKTLISGSTERLNYCAAMSYTVYRKITATSSATSTEYTTKYYGDAACTDAELLSSDAPITYVPGVCSTKALSVYSFKMFRESKITTELQVPRFSLV